MSYSIIGFGAVGQALARMFARKAIGVGVAATRTREALAAQAQQIGPKVTPLSLAEAIQADTLLLAVPYWSHRDIAAASSDWSGKIIIDVTNAFGVPPADLGERPSSALIAEAFVGAALVKAFNHLPAKVLAADPVVDGGRRVVFLSSDDEAATASVAALAERLGFAPVMLGALAEGGQLVQARGQSWAPLIFQDLFKFG